MKTLGKIISFILGMIIGMETLSVGFLTLVLATEPESYKKRTKRYHSNYSNYKYFEKEKQEETKNENNC